LNIQDYGMDNQMMPIEITITIGIENVAYFSDLVA